MEALTLSEVSAKHCQLAPFCQNHCAACWHNWSGIQGAGLVIERAFKTLHERKLQVVVRIADKPSLLQLNDIDTILHATIHPSTLDISHAMVFYYCMSRQLASVIAVMSAWQPNASYSELEISSSSGNFPIVYIAHFDCLVLPRVRDQGSRVATDCSKGSACFQNPTCLPVPTSNGGFAGLSGKGLCHHGGPAAND